MKTRLHTLTGIVAGLGMALSAYADAPKDSSYKLENKQIGRELSLVDGRLVTSKIFNHRTGQVILPVACDEFQLRISNGTHTTGTDVILTTADFKCSEVLREDSKGNIEFVLRNEKHGLSMRIRYVLEKGDFFMRKQIEIVSDKAVTLERLDVEAVTIKDAHQPYTMREITTTKSPKLKKLGWRPGLGQPLFTKDTSTFWGIEFPAADNQVVKQELLCGYQYGHELKQGQTYTSYKAVMGCGDDPKFTSDAFYEYIDTVRVRPLRLQIQYNSWFDFYKDVSAPDFNGSVEKVNRKLCMERGVPPLNAYVIDDGWQTSEKGKDIDWSKEVWSVNEKFDPAFESSFAAARKAKSELGIWLSPQCNFGARLAVPSMRKAGMGALQHWMSLANTPYMDKLEGRLVELTKQGFTYFKLDGTFGNLRTREFDLTGKEHGVPVMPQLVPEDFKPADDRLSDSKYDEAKIYYLTVGTERMMKIFAEMSKANPEVFIVISNGAYLSPWWLMHVDSVWMINAGDAAGGSSRTDELVYRDSVYYDIWKEENTHFPMSALFNHEPKKTGTGESEDAFRRYLYMNLSRGTGFIELYLVTKELSEKDWDVLADGLKWAHEMFPVFKRVQMHGGDPGKAAVYGFSAWSAEKGYVSIHNPSDKPQSYKLVLDRSAGLIPGETSYQVSSQLAGGTEGLKRSYRFGEALSIELKAKEIRVIDFKTAR